MENLSFLSTLTLALKEYPSLAYSIISTHKSEFLKTISSGYIQDKINKINIRAFDQLWSDTSCGWGGLAGQAFRNKEVVVIEIPEFGIALVYIGKYAYTCEIDETYQTLLTAKKLPGWFYLDHSGLKIWNKAGRQK